MWTRSANVSTTRNVNNINTSGTANNNNNASNTYALLPDNASTNSREVSPDKNPLRNRKANATHWETTTCPMSCIGELAP